MTLIILDLLLETLNALRKGVTQLLTKHLNHRRHALPVILPAEQLLSRRGTLIQPNARVQNTRIHHILLNRRDRQISTRLRTIVEKHNSTGITLIVIQHPSTKMLQ